jgi:ribonuclease HI
MSSQSSQSAMSLTFVKGKDSSDIKNVLRFDGGACPSNPGPCAGAYVLFKEDGKVLTEGGEFIENGTNNYGEYTGLICGLRKCKELEIDNVYVEGDSLLVISQVCKKWKVKSETLMILLDEVNELLKSFSNVGMRHIYRDNNKYADSLSDKTIKLKKSWNK